MVNGRGVLASRSRGDGGSYSDDREDSYMNRRSGFSGGVEGYSEDCEDE